MHQELNVEKVNVKAFIFFILKQIPTKFREKSFYKEGYLYYHILYYIIPYYTIPYHTKPNKFMKYKWNVAIDFSQEYEVRLYQRNHISEDELKFVG